MSTPPKGFISAPSLEQLKPTPEELAELDALQAWQNQSAKSHYILGGFIICRHCHNKNNPNNTMCWDCNKPL